MQPGEVTCLILLGFFTGTFCHPEKNNDSQKPNAHCAELKFVNQFEKAIDFGIENSEVTIQFFIKSFWSLETMIQEFTPREFSSDNLALFKCHKKSVSSSLCCYFEKLRRQQVQKPWQCGFVFCALLQVSFSVRPSVCMPLCRINCIRMYVCPSNNHFLFLLLFDPEAF